MGIKILDIIMKQSFIFSILTYAIPYNTLGSYSIVYSMCIIVTYLGCYLKEKGKFYYIVGLLLLPCLFLLREEGSVVFLISVIAFIYFTIIRYTGLLSYGHFIDSFKSGFRFYILIVLLSFITGTTSFINNISGFFMIIYFITSVILLRSLRHIENNQNMDKINKQNTLYSILILAFSVLLPIEEFVQFVVNGVKFTYNLIADLFFKVFYWLFMGAGYISMLLVEFFKKFFAGQEVKPEEASENAEDIMEILKNKEPEEIAPIVVLIIDWIIRILIIVFIIYIIGKMFKRIKSKKHVKEEYIEESEFIRVKEIKEKKKRNIFRPRGEKAQIRYYYRKFLNKCLKNDIPIGKQDTTEEINKKASNNYESEPLDNLRSTYVKVRYGDKEVDKRAVKEYKKEFKKI